MYASTAITLASHVSLLTAVQVANHVMDHHRTEIFTIIIASVMLDTTTSVM